MTWTQAGDISWEPYCQGVTLDLYSQSKLQLLRLMEPTWLQDDRG